jgi:glutamine---fructose-6-phosphate transaminase (isomerizing)
MKRRIELSLELDAIAGRYLSDLLSQPQALDATWRKLRETKAPEEIVRLTQSGRFDRIVLTGMGSSYFALHPLSIQLAENGWTPLMLETSELVHFYSHLLMPATLVVAVSQSGQSAEMVRLLELNAGNAAIIGVTNNESGPLAKQANVAVLTAAGDEYSVSCKTYLCTLMALQVVGAALCGLEVAQCLRGLEEAGEKVQSYLHHWKSHVLEFCDLLHDVRDMFLVGRGPSLGAACTGALILKEAAHFHAEAMSSAALRHGPFEMLGPGIFIGVFAGSERTRALNEKLADDLERSGVQAVLFSSHSRHPACRLPDVSEFVRPMVEILPVQMMTLALGAIANREPGVFERATKVTDIE